ncbi:LysR family transcriptional regulator, partial [Acinetobacter baumannii]
MLSTRHEIFLEVAQKNSFSKASETLFISQPAITKHIKLLEAYYKPPMFERKGSKIILTPVGELLFKKLNEVKKIQNQL